MQRRNEMKANSKGYMTSWLLVVALIVPTLWAAQSHTPDTWTMKDLKQAIATAKTADDHNRIAQYYRIDAGRLKTQAKEHAELAETYRKSPTYHEQKHPMSGQTAGHCQWLADQYAQMAEKELDLAKDHEEMAKSVSK
jgi:hypothetical protein